MIITCPSLFQSEHRCTQVEYERMEETEKCGNFINWFIKGYEIDMTKSVFAHMSPADIQGQLLEFATDADNSPECTFFM